MITVHKRTSGQLWNQLVRLEQRWARQAPKASPAAVPTFADLNGWARHYLADYFTLPNSRFHDWLANQLHTLHTRRGTRMALVAPRGSAKSTWVSLVYPLWAAVHNQEPYILLFNKIQKDWKKYLLDVRAFCFDGNVQDEDVEDDWRVENNPAHRWYHMPWQHYGPNGRRRYSWFDKGGSSTGAAALLVPNLFWRTDLCSRVLQ
jgi:hypothetical protein